MEFKYKDDLNSLVGQGYKMPPLYDIELKEAYRFVFEKDIDKNHIPPYKLQPNRLKQQIKKENVKTSGFALSNFESEEKAVAFYDYLCRVCRNVRKQIGDSLSYGVLDSTDGKITDVDAKGHFDLYEFYTCDLSTKFNIVRPL